MAKGYKIKRSNNRIYKRNRNKSRSPLGVAGVVLLIAALFVTGWFVYPPVYDLITGQSKVSPVSQPEPSEPSQADAPEETPPPPPEKPEQVQRIRAVYAPPALLLNEEDLAELLGKASAEGCNTLLFDLKEDDGTVLYRTANQAAINAGAVSETPFDLAGVLALLEQYDMRPMGRLFTMKDHLMPRADVDTTILYNGEVGQRWLDNRVEQGGRPWMNPYSVRAQDYNIALAVECAQQGVSTILADGVQFPSGVPGLDLAGYGETGGKTQAEVLLEFVTRMESALEAEGAGLLTVAPVGALMNLTGYDAMGRPGEYPALVVNCMPAIWGAGNTAAELTKPVQNPYDTVLSTLRAAQSGTRARLVPLIQAYTDAEVPAEAGMTYGAEEIAAQLDALGELQLEEYILYSPDGAYPF